MGQGGFKINDCTKQAPVDISLLRQESFTNSWMRRIFLITNQIMINFPKKSKMIKESLFRGSLDNKMAARKASIWALFTQCSPYEYLQFTQTIQTTPTRRKANKWFFKMLNVHIHDYVDYTYLQLNGLWLDRAQAGGNIDLLSSQIENISGICSELNLEKGTV